MRFELSIALKYLIPKWRQLSVSIISLLSIVVISLVVWLLIVFLSISEGIEKKWIEELVAINAPIRLVPKEEYFNSYYYQIDHLSFASNYSPKSIGEKLSSSQNDPYDPSIDPELPLDFPSPDLNQEGSIKDLVKEGWNTITDAKQDYPLTPHEFEVRFGNLKLTLARNESPLLAPQKMSETILSQISYIASFSGENKRLSALILPLQQEDFSNLLSNLDMQREQSPSNFHERIVTFFDHLTIKTLITGKEGWILPQFMIPKKGSWKGCALVSQGKILKIFVPKEKQDVQKLDSILKTLGYSSVIGDLQFESSFVSFTSSMGDLYESLPINLHPLIVIEGGVELEAEIDLSTVSNISSVKHIPFFIHGNIQGTSIEGKVPYHNFEIGKINYKDKDSSSYWIQQGIDKKFSLPLKNSLGDGILLPKSYKENGAKLGDTGVISYQNESASSYQEMRLPVYVAGFFDPGVVPIGNRVIFASPSVTAQLRSNYSPSDQMIGNGIAVFLDNLKLTEQAKKFIDKELKERNLDKYWKVESFSDFELTQPILQQLRSDKTLFTLIAIIILIVACSNIISMLILLVNDKRKEIGILQSMGASKFGIALIFGICGLITGICASVIGTVTAIITLNNLQVLVSFLNFLQGHEAFHQAFYGNSLPNELSISSLGFIVAATLLISLLAGVIPAIKAAKIRPSQILRSES